MFTPLMVAPAKGVHNRQMPGVLIIDDLTGRIRYSNQASAMMLKPMLGPDARLGFDHVMPGPLQSLLDEVALGLATRPDACAVMLPAYDLCVRACKLTEPDGSCTLLLIERAGRRDVVRSALANYPLTPREAEVAELVLRGYSNRRIASHLVLTEYTVEDHLKRIFAKMGVRSRSALSSKILGIREEATG